jgi:glycerophosphoryl diester phosphodiesterase
MGIGALAAAVAVLDVLLRVIPRAATDGHQDGDDRPVTIVPRSRPLGGTADYRTDLYATGGTLLSHAESIELIANLGAKFTPELKSVDPGAGFGHSGLTQETYARKMIQEYIDAGIKDKEVYAQSFNIVAPPMATLLETDGDNNIVPSGYARNASKAGLKIISWTTERSGRIIDGVPEGGNYYYQTTLDGLDNDGDILRTIDVLAQDVGVIGLFSDWPATTTFYANCMIDKK